MSINKKGRHGSGSKAKGWEGRLAAVEAVGCSTLVCGYIDGVIAVSSSSFHVRVVVRSCVTAAFRVACCRVLCCL